MPSVPQGYNVFFDIIQRIQDEGIDLPFQDTLNFVGAGVTAVDDAGNGRTNVNIPGQVPHDLLDGNIAQDTFAQTVSPGSIIFGNATPLWDELVVGTPGQVLTVVGGFPAWATPAPSVGVWEDLADESPSADTDVITVNFSARRYLRVYVYLHANGGGTIDTVMTINGDSTTEYATRRSSNGGADVIGTNQSGIELDVGGVSEHSLIIIDIEDTLNHTKMGFTKTVQTDAPDEFTAPERQINHFTYSVGTARITSLTFTNNDPGSYTNVSQVRVLGFN